MKAAVYKHYGPPEVLFLKQVPEPTPGDHEVRVRVCATTVSIGDIRMRSFTVPRAQWLFARLYLGIFQPRRSILGMEIAGEIDAIGPMVTRFKVGDPVFASTFEEGFGGYAEYKCLNENGAITLKPSDLSFEEAACVVGGGITAMHCLRRARIRPGQHVLVYGASGAVGSSAVQLAKKHYGAEVTAVCGSANQEWVKALGADHMLDYTRDDFAGTGPIYDVVFDAVARCPESRARAAVKEGGVYLHVHRDSDGEQGRTLRDDLVDLKALIEAGMLRPVIDRCYPLDAIVEAHQYVGLGHKKGNVAVTIAPH